MQIFDYPPNPIRSDPAIFPSAAVIQGNLEPSRRNYDKILSHLRVAMTQEPKLWGYQPSTEGEGAPLMPLEGGSPFQLHLVGQRNKDRPVTVPVELQNVVYYHEKLSYPDYYTLIANCVSPAPQILFYISSSSITVRAPPSLHLRQLALGSRYSIQKQNVLSCPSSRRQYS